MLVSGSFGGIVWEASIQTQAKGGSDDTPMLAPENSARGSPTGKKSYVEVT